MATEAMQTADRLAFNIIGALHKLFGFSYSRNTEQYVYQITLDTPIDFAVGTTAIGSLRISQEADFIATRLNVETRYLASTGNPSAVGSLYLNTFAGDAVAAESDAAQDVPFDIEITDGSTDRVLQNEPVSARAAYGMTGGLPGIWSKPRMFARNSNVAVKLTCLRPAVGANNESLRTKVLFIGWKIYDTTSLDLTTRRP